MNERELMAAMQPSMLQLILNAPKPTEEEAAAAESEWAEHTIPLLYPGKEKCPRCPTLIDRSMTNRVYCRFCVSKLKASRGISE